MKSCTSFSIFLAFLSNLLRKKCIILEKIKQLIQVTHASSLDEIEKRELRSLIKASKQLKCNSLLCITWDYESEETFKEKKIKFIPLWKFLLNIS